MARVQVDARCPKCAHLGMPSVAFLAHEMRTLAAFGPFNDAEGRQHLHDGNTVTKHYECSAGHTWSEKIGPPPCFCGWPDNEEND